MKTVLVTAVAAATALLPGAANAADRHEVTLEPTARLTPDGTRAVVTGTYTCEGVRGPVRLRVTLRTQHKRELNADEKQAVSGLYQWLGLPELPVPKKATSSTSREQILEGTCDGTATAHPWRHTFIGGVEKGTEASVTVAMTSVDSRTAQTKTLADATGDVTFA
ncbi:MULTISPECIES: hypothetical protein [Streptomyces]|uniref:Secreted protein n=1 Tax=Streptomyces venezuelae TaxID=54571 RepID=A0A5P2BDF9_STRVZ|nr:MULTISPECIES: hypothetical protein [Streptomyces]NDZ97937.1 hypothetical protein [Streptomyces sp. SID10116]MYY80495.1 hypothetical protein [Streptomyces sp. SID335]MYZ14838.1 hypothetical protein [Streptomyces sp. SID337]NDZ91744.1 hypothetical protein [Streptomyces sp. SID10115]NEB44585.1 hypothetical protein [Streptomyces sp. SID339]